MTWQDDLRQLDAEVAAGRISLEDYQRRRNDLVAAAADAGPGAPATQQQGPFAPPFRLEASSLESTQLIHPVPAEDPPGQESSANATQVVPTGSTQPPPSDWTQIVSPQARQAGREWDRTQVVPGELRQQPQQGFTFPPPQQDGFGGPPGWGQPGGNSGPPWRDSNLPPFDTGAPWIRQGPEVEARSGATPIKIISIVAAVVLLLGAAFGAYWIWGRGGTTQQAGGTSQTSQPGQPTTSTPSGSTPSGSTPSGSTSLTLAALSGAVQNHPEIKSFGDVAKLNYLNQSELLAYQAAKASDAVLVVRLLPNDTATVVLLVQADSNGSAATAAQALDQVQRSNGMTAANSAPKGVRVCEVPAKDGEKAKIRGHYSHNGVIVRVDEIGADLSSVRQDFLNVVDAELKVMPADG